MINPQDWRDKTLDQRYQITALVRNTKTGALFRAYDRNTGETVALEIVDKALSGQPTFPGRFVKEVQRAIAYPYPNLPTVRLVVHQSSDDGVCYVVTDLLKSYPLRDLLNTLSTTEQLSLADAVELIQQLCFGIEFADRVGLLPRDLQPQFIGIMPTVEDQATLAYRPVLEDLGLSALLVPGSLPQDAMSPDWLQYIAPESLPPNYRQAEVADGIRAATAPIDPRSQVYLLGVLLYELAVKVTPFPAVTTVEQARQTLSTLPPAPRILNPDIPQVVEQVMLTALAKQPLERYDTPGMLAAALARILPVAQTIDNSGDRRQRTGALTAGGNNRLRFGNSAKAPAANTRTYISLDELLHRGSSQLGNQASGAFGAATTRPASSFIIKVDKPLLAVKPGTPQISNITVSYTGSETDHIWIDVQGPGQEWCKITPDQSNPPAVDYQGLPAVFTLIATPPAGPQSRAGTYPLVLEVKSDLAAQRPAHPNVAKTGLDLLVERVPNLLISDIWPKELRPKEVAQVRLENGGNAPETVNFDLRGKSRELHFDPPNLTAVVDAGHSLTLEFAPNVRRPYLGRTKLYDFVANAVSQGTEVTKQLTGQVQAHRLIPYWLLALAVCLLLFSLLGLLLFQRPSISRASTDPACLNWYNIPPVTVTETMLVVCWQNVEQAESLSLLLEGAEAGADREILIRNLTQQSNEQTQRGAATKLVTTTNLAPVLVISQLITNGVYFYPINALQAPVTGVRLKARNYDANAQNWLLPFSTVLSERLAYLLLTPPPPQPKIVRFCLADADNPQSDSCLTNRSTFAVIPGLTKTLFLSWQVENVANEQVELTPKNIPFDLAQKGVALPAPSDPVTYTLRVLGTNGGAITQKAIGVLVVPVVYTITAPALNLRKSPGIDYEQVNPQDHPLVLGTRVILLSKPVNFAQNNDNFEWVKVRVEATDEEGWLVFRDGITGAQYLTTTVASVALGAEPIADLEKSNSSANNGAEQSSGSQSAMADAPAAGQGVQTSGADAEAALALPVEQPEFGPTLTPTPTLTSTPTPAPVDVDIRISKDQIERGECVLASWTIEHVRAVYFDFGTGELQPSNDNTKRTVEFCQLTKTTDFEWHIVFADQDDNPANDQVRVERRTVIVKPRETPTPFTILVVTPTWTPADLPPPVQGQQ